MSFQSIYDTKGKPIGVFVPINKWEKITTELNNNIILKSLAKGMKQVSQIEKGKLKGISLKQLFDAL